MKKNKGYLGEKKLAIMLWGLIAPPVGYLLGEKVELILIVHINCWVIFINKAGLQLLGHK